MEGGEFSLEQVRAKLPQYHCSFPEDSAGEMDMELTTVNGGIIDMEMTEACPVHIATGPGFGKTMKQSAGMGGVLKGRISRDKENQPLEVLRVLDQENASVGPGSAKPSRQPERKPLQPIPDGGRDVGMKESERGERLGTSRDDICTAEEELERLCKEKPFSLSTGSVQKSQQGQSHPKDDIDQQLEQLVLEKASLQKPLAPSSSSFAPREKGAEPRERQCDQENRPRVKLGEHGEEEGFNFTPGTVAGGPNLPMRAAWLVKLTDSILALISVTTTYTCM